MKAASLMRTSVLCLLSFALSSILFAQGTGVIVRPASLSASQSILDPVAPAGYTSKTTAGFNGDDVGNSKLPFKPIPSFSTEPYGDLRRGPGHLYSDFVPDVNNYGVYVHFDGTNFLFRMRLGSIVPGAKGYSILIDADGKFGATGPNADPNFQAATTGTNGNPGFEIEVDLFTQNTTSPGVVIYDVDGTSTPVQKKAYTNWMDYSQVSIAGTNDNGDPDFFLDFYVPLADLTTYFGVTASTPLRMNATTVMAPQAAVGGPKSDLYGLADSGYKDTNAEWEAYINAQPSFTPTSLNNTSTTVIGSICTAPPTLNPPITTGATSVSGTWTQSTLSGAAGTATIKIYVDGVYSGNSVTANSGIPWTVTGLTALAASKVITAKAVAASESECLSSNAVTVTSCNSATKPATPVLSCTTFQKGLTGTNRGSTNSTLWVVHVDNLSTNDLRNSTTDLSNAYFSNLTGSNWDFSSGCTTGSQMTAGSYKIYYTDNTGCNSEPLFICVSPGKAGTNVAGTLGTPTITSPSTGFITTAVNTISGTTQATTNGTAMTLYVDNFPVATTTATAAGAFSFSNLKLLQGQSLYITSEYNTGTQSTSYCEAKTAAYTVTCFTSVPGINSNATGQLVAGAPITGTSGEPSGTTVKVYTAAGTLVATAAVSNGSWTTGAYTAVAGTSYYANATNGSCGVSGNTASVATPSSVTSASRCGTIAGGLMSSSTTVSGTIAGSAASPITAGTKVNVYQDGTNIGTYTFTASSTNAAAPWSIAVSAYTLYAGGVLTFGVQEGGTAGEVICGSSATVSCTGPLTPSYTQQSSNGTSGPGATVPKGGTMTYTITNLSPNTFYSVADATSGQAYASGVWTGGTTTSGSTITVTTYPLSASGTYNGAIKATSVTATDMCSTTATLSSFTVLPVTLIELRGEHTDGANVLHWQTAGEGNAVRFEVERSADGVNFLPIGSVPASGSNSAYAFTDNRLSAPVHYYRLRMMDAGGKAAYSKIIVIKDNGTSITLGAVRPNPVVSELTVSFSSGGVQTVKLELVDAAGRSVATKQLRSVPGLNNVKLEGLAALPKGLYVLKVRADAVQLQQKLLKVN